MMSTTKYTAVMLVLLVAGASAASKSWTEPVSRVVELLEDLRAQVVTDGETEKTAYDTYACWVETKLKEKAAEIKEAKVEITELTEDITKLKASLAVHETEIMQILKDRAYNVAEQNKAQEIRDREIAEYTANKAELEDAIEALHEAIGILAGKGHDKVTNRRNLRVLQQATYLGEVGQLKDILSRPFISQAVTPQQYEVVKSFLDHPASLLSQKSKVFSAAQMTQPNPFGDYAPQSMEIQGILKTLVETFSVKIKKMDEEEAKKAAAFAEIMDVWKAEERTLTITLQKHQAEAGRVKVMLYDKEVLRDQVRESLKLAEEFYDNTKKAAQAKALQWAERTRLRTEEINGMDKAIDILKGGAATFTASGHYFLQLKSSSNHAINRVDTETPQQKAKRKVAFTKLRTLASTSAKHSLDLARIAVQVQTQGHFDAVIQAIEVMIKTLQEEQSDDNFKKDSCTKQKQENQNEIDALTADITKLTEDIAALNTRKGELETRKTTLEGEIEALSTQITTATATREAEFAAMSAAIKDDMNAVELIDAAIKSLSGLYTRNDISMTLAQKKQQTHKEDPPDTGFQTGAYEGRKSESGGIIAILEMIKEDIQNEIGTETSDGNENAQQYWISRDGLEAEKQAKVTEKVTTEKDLATTIFDIEMAEKTKRRKVTAKDLADKMKANLEADCAWVATNFDSRKTKRDTEIAGLEDAKSYLEGASP